MPKNSLFIVPYLGEIAKFSSYKDAMLFAQAVSAAKEVIEVRHTAGVVGQYWGGRPTPRFEEHHAELFGKETSQEESMAD